MASTDSGVLSAETQRQQSLGFQGWQLFMSFKSFLTELGQLIHHRSVISCTYPKLVALETVNELTELNCAFPGLNCSKGAEVIAHVNQHQNPSVLFITEHLADGLGLELVQTLSTSRLDHRCVLILTHNHDLNRDGINDPSISAVVLDHNIGRDTCVLEQALKAVNRNQRFVDPELSKADGLSSANTEPLSDRELEVLGLVAEGLSNREVAERLYLAPTTVRDHLQSLMRKMDVRSRTGAAVAGLRMGLLAG